MTAQAPTPLLTFRPSPPLRRLQSDDAPLVAIRACNKAGKTYAVMRKLAARAVSRPGSRHRVVGPSRAQVREVTGRYLWHYLQGYLHPSSRWYAGTGWNRNGIILLANGSEIQLSSYQDDPQVQEGRHDLDTIVLDEVPPYSHFMANKGRAQHQLILAFTIQSKAAPAWLRREIEGEESNPAESPTEGRTEHATGWTQYVVPLLRQNVPWMTEEQYDKQVRMFEGTDEAARRIHAAWEGTDEDRKFGGWSARLVRTPEQLVEELWVGRKSAWDWVRLGMDHGSSGPGKQCVYLLFGRGGRYYVAQEWLGTGTTSVPDIAVGIRDSLKAWNLDVRHLEAMFGDINSAGPAGAGQKLNELIGAELARLLGIERLPRHGIQAPVKTGGWREAREAAINYAMLEGRWFVSSQCQHAIRAFGNYGGHPRDPLKDPIDAIGYAVQDRIVEVVRPPAPGILRH